jgi:hypothetical protein
VRAGTFHLDLAAQHPSATSHGPQMDDQTILLARISGLGGQHFAIGLVNFFADAGKRPEQHARLVKI